MHILGLSSFQHDTAAALLEDGAVRVAIENDKLARARTRNRPELAILSCFESAGIGWDGVGLVAAAVQPLNNWRRKSWLRVKLSATAPVASAYYAADEAGALARDLNHLRVLRRYAVGSDHKVIGFDHHLCHAASAFFLSPFDKSLIVTMDEGGHGTASTLAVGEGNRIRVLRNIPFPNSLAWVYSQVTDLAGFQPHVDEHKTQWLSLEGDPVYKDVFVKVFRHGRGAVPRLNYRFFRRGLANQISFSEKFYRVTSLPNDRRKVTEEQKKNLAASIQAACVELIAPLVEELWRKEKIEHVCFAGGLFQNVLLVAALEKHLGADRVCSASSRQRWDRAGSGFACLAPRVEKSQAERRRARLPGTEIRSPGDKRCSRQHQEPLHIVEDRRAKVRLDGATVARGEDRRLVSGCGGIRSASFGNRSVLASPWAAIRQRKSE